MPWTAGLAGNWTLSSVASYHLLRIDADAYHRPQVPSVCRSRPAAESEHAASTGHGTTAHLIILDSLGLGALVVGWRSG